MKHAERCDIKTNAVIAQRHVVRLLHAEHRTTVVEYVDRSGGSMMYTRAHTRSGPSTESPPTTHRVEAPAPAPARSATAAEAASATLTSRGAAEPSLASTWRRPTRRGYYS